MIEKQPFREGMPEVPKVTDKVSKIPGLSPAVIHQFDQQLRGIETHKRAGFLESFYMRVQNSQDPETLQLAAGLLTKWNNTISGRTDFTPHALKLSSTASKFWALKQMARVTKDPELIAAGAEIMVSTRDAIQNLFVREAGLDNPLAPTLE